MVGRYKKEKNSMYLPTYVFGRSATKKDVIFYIKLFAQKNRMPDNITIWLQEFVYLKRNRFFKLPHQVGTYSLYYNV